MKLIYQTNVPASSSPQELVDVGTKWCFDNHGHGCGIDFRTNNRRIKLSPVQWGPGLVYLNTLKHHGSSIMRELWAWCRFSVKRNHVWLVFSHRPVIFPRVLPSSVSAQRYLFFPWRPTHHWQLLSVSITHMCKGLHSLHEAGRETTQQYWVLWRRSGLVAMFWFVTAHTRESCRDKQKDTFY